MGLNSVVIDNDSLVNLFEINKANPNFFTIIRSLYSEIHIPLEVKNEFLYFEDLTRSRFIENLRFDKGFFCLCNRYDIMILKLLESYSRIHKGEKELVAQRLKVGATFILSDDRKFAEDLSFYDSSIKVINTFHVLAQIDLEKITETKRYILSLFAVKPFREEQLKNAYLDIATMKGIRLGPKRLKDLTSFKKIGIHLPK